MRAILLDQHVRVDAQLLDRLCLQGLDAQPLLGARHLVAMNRVGEIAQIIAQRADLAPDKGQRGITLCASAFGANALGGRLFERASHTLHRVCRAATDRDRHRCLSLATLPACRRPLTGGELGTGRGLQGLSPPLHGAGALLSCAQAQAQFGLGGARLGGTVFEPVTFVARGFFFARIRARVVQPLTQREVLRAVTSQCGLGCDDCPLDPLGLATPCPNRASKLPQPLSDRSHPGVGLVEALESGLHRVVGCCRHLSGSREGELGLLSSTNGVLGLVTGLVDGRLDLDQAGC